MNKYKFPYQKRFDVLARREALGKLKGTDWLELWQLSEIRRAYHTTYQQRLAIVRFGTEMEKLLHHIAAKLDELNKE